MSAAQAKQEQRWQAALARPSCGRCFYAKPEIEAEPLDPPTLHCALGKFVTHAMAVCGSFVQRTS